MNLLQRDEFIKASPAIQIQGSLTHLQRRAWKRPTRQRLRRVAE